MLFVGSSPFSPLPAPSRLLHSGGAVLTGNLPSEALCPPSFLLLCSEVTLLRTFGFHPGLNRLLSYGGLLGWFSFSYSFTSRTVSTYKEKIQNFAHNYLIFKFL
jgi:hypothetical protein